MLAEKQTEVCVVCCRDILVFATGQCDHTVCYDCSTRLRVICEQNECPICRTEVPQVLFTHNKTSFSLPRRKPQLINEKYGIIFEDNKIKRNYECLLENRCCECEEEIFSTFDKLNRHMKLTHGLHYCQLCVENLKVFPFERKLYNRRDLATHNRKGDANDTSYRGHPRCEYCEQRFFDKDELFRHLRKEHFFCHFCDSEGKFEFYENHNYLKAHFRSQHFLCEEDDCARGELIAFRSEFDFKAHRALEHTRNKTKAEVKQVRTLDLKFSLTPRINNYGELAQNDRHSNKNSQHQKRNTEETSSRDVVDAPQAQSKTFSANCDQDFPQLLNDAQGNSNMGPSSSYSNRVNSQRKPKNESKAWASKLQGNVEDFPALPSSSTRPTKTTNPIAETNKPTIARLPHKSRLAAKSHNVVKPPPKKMPARNSEEFPELESRVPFGSSQVFTDKMAKAIYNRCKEMPKKSKANLTNGNEDEEEAERKTNNPLPLSEFCTGLGNRPGEAIEAQKAKERFREKYKKANNTKDEVPWREDVTFGMNDFPPLGSSATIAPPGFKNSAPPPGFSSFVPPPGFSSKNGVQLNGHKPQEVEDAQLKNSVQYQYQPPEPGFHERNQKLIEKIKELTDSSELFEEFKVLSGRFRMDIITTEDYHSKCLNILGKDKFLEIITELMCLLPDIKKQQGLLKAHTQYLNKNEVKHCKTGNKKRTDNLLTCPQCQQVLSKTDIRGHVH